ncbi:prepilin-type N-terminal cleavage/methylation domain-containing protein [Pseudomonas stutzeri]|uniref:Type II secretion system protein n=1 Tax=Stutzerimonas stutzeri TaxID=316 RepID=A0A2N8SN63_STUST|nr:prepilin-type N-terminal cleavage/methylation domain-containing protein [Stutzerimonas stutzeri]MCQ4250032.1 prepilin-type N-terminal cleavage/methylation domain-containing protein [Stutzerimonas stutzeri]PNG03909.1 type II secretion system protein [Stutzerimonas stutzeri]
MKSSRGFTLVELVIVIALSAVVLVMITAVLKRPLDAFIDQSRRGELVELASVALNRMARDIRLAVPNSVRQSVDGRTLETLNILNAGRYVSNRAGGEGLRFSADVSGCDTANGRCDGFQVLERDFDVTGTRWMVVYNLGASSGGNPTVGSNIWAYANPGVITPTGTTFSAAANAISGETQLTLGGTASAGFIFAYPSPQRRFYLADQVIGYRCDPSASGGQLVRYTRTTLSATAPSVAPADAVQVAPYVTGCQINYQPGTPQRPGLVTLSLTLTRDGESITLQQQVKVDNAP